MLFFNLPSDRRIWGVLFLVFSFFLMASLVLPLRAENPIPQKQIIIGNSSIRRTIALETGKESKVAIKAGGELNFDSREFEIVCRRKGESLVINRANSTFVGSPNEVSQNQVTLRWKAPSAALEIRTEYRVDAIGPYLFKWLEVANYGNCPVLIERVMLENLELKGTPEPLRGGVGQPILLNNEFFFGIEHPAAINEALTQGVILSHSPFAELAPGAVWKSHRAVIGAVMDKKESVEDAFRNYLVAVTGRGPKLRTTFNDWAAHDELGTLAKPQLSEQLAKTLLDTLQDLKVKYGVQFDHYLMDAFWYDPKGSFLEFKKPNWPNGYEPVLQRILSVGMKPGLWFDLGASTLDLKGTPNWSGPEKPCLADSAFLQMLGKAFEYHIRNHSLSLLKFDFANLLCSSAGDGRPSIAVWERNADALRQLCDQARREKPDLVIRAYNLFSVAELMSSTKYYDETYAISPWWLFWFDSIYSGDPRASELPSVTSLRDSVNWYQDHVYRGYARSLLPLFMIDDCGAMVGRTSTILYLGAENFTDSWILTIMRGHLAPIFHRDITLLNENDKKFMAGTLQFLKDHQPLFARTKPILGIPGEGQIYGYLSRFENLASITLVNPGLFPQDVSFHDPATELAGGYLKLLFSNDGEAREPLRPWAQVLHGTLLPGEIRVYAIGPRERVEPLLLPPAPTRQYHKVEPLGDIFRGGREATLQLEPKNAGMTLALVIQYDKGGRPDRSFDRPQEVLRVNGELGSKAVRFSSIPREGTDIWSRNSWAVFKHIVIPEEQNELLKLKLEGMPPPGTDWTITALWLK